MTTFVTSQIPFRDEAPAEVYATKLANETGFEDITVRQLEDESYVVIAVIPTADHEEGRAVSRVLQEVLPDDGRAPQVIVTTKPEGEAPGTDSVPITVGSARGSKPSPFNKSIKYRQAYQATQKFRDSQRRYQQGPGGAAAQRKYASSDKGKEARRKYQQSEKGRAARQRYLEKKKAEQAAASEA